MGVAKISALHRSVPKLAHSDTTFFILLLCSFVFAFTFFLVLGFNFFAKALIVMRFSMTGLLVYRCLSSNIYIALTDIVPLHCLQSMPAGAMMSNSWRLLFVVSKCIKPLIRAHLGGQ